MQLLIIEVPMYGHMLVLDNFGVQLVFKAHRLFYHSTLGLRVKKKKEEGTIRGGGWRERGG